MPVRTSSASPKTSVAAQCGQTAALERLDRGIERRGEEDRDHDPRQDVPGEIDEQEHEPDEHRTLGDAGADDQRRPSCEPQPEDAAGRGGMEVGRGRVRNAPA